MTRSELDKYFKDEDAKKAAITYANNILKTVEVYRSE